MGRSANVNDIDALKTFRLALLKFAEKGGTSIGEADGEVQRIAIWLENEAQAYWTVQVRVRHQAVQKAKEDLRFKQIFKSASGGKNSTIDEEKALAKAMRAFAEAEAKLANVKKWIRNYHKEMHMYRGAVSRLSTTLSTTVPNASARISRMITALEGYVALAAPEFGPIIESSDSSGVSRGSGPALVGGHKRFRLLTPDGPAKDSAKPGAIDPWTGAALANGNLEALAAVPGEKTSIDPASLVILAPGAETAARIYLERSASGFAGDSGWYIAPATSIAATEFRSAPLQQILDARPDFAEILSLAVGSLVVIDQAGIAAILSADDQDLWSTGAKENAAEGEKTPAESAGEPT